MRYFFGLVLSHALGYVAAPLAKPEREHLADQLVRERDEVVHANYQVARDRDRIERRERDTRAVRVRDLIRERRNRNFEYF